MLYAVGTPLPEYRVRACTSQGRSTNLIHEDEHARRIGFRSGLVSGASVYGYMSRSLVEMFGRDWLTRGSSEVRFVHPFYEGEEVRVKGCLTASSREGGVCAEYAAVNAQGVVCAAGTAGLPLRAPAPEPVLEDYPASELPPCRPISLDTLVPGDPLIPVTSQFTWKIQWEYCQKTVRDHHPVYAQVAHPGWLLSRTSRVVEENFDLPAWIHVFSRVQKYRCLESEGAVDTRGRVVDRFERKGHHCAVLDIAVFSGAQCLETIRHSIIFRIAPRAA